MVNVVFFGRRIEIWEGAFKNYGQTYQNMRQIKKYHLKYNLRDF